MRARPWHRLSLTQSFRSTRPVLEFVDSALELLPKPGMGLIADRERHASEVPGPGTVSLWPLVIAGAGDEDEEGWIGDATRALAGQIARTIKGWVGTLMLESKGRTLQPEDIMILVKRRGDLASLIVARLYAEGVPVAGVDRLRLNAPLSVQDLPVRDPLRVAAGGRSVAGVAAGLAVDRVEPGAIDGRRAQARGQPVAAYQQDAAAQRSRAGLCDARSRRFRRRPISFSRNCCRGRSAGGASCSGGWGQEARDPIEELLSAAARFRINRDAVAATLP